MSELVGNSLKGRNGTQSHLLKNLPTHAVSCVLLGYVLSSDKSLDIHTVLCQSIDTAPFTLQCFCAPCIVLIILNFHMGIYGGLS